MMRVRFVLTVLCCVGLSGIAIGQTITEYPIPTAQTLTFGITAGPDGNVWFTELMYGPFIPIGPPPGLTNVGVEWKVTDTLTGALTVCSSAVGTPFRPIQDSSAFPCS
jgi:hypothetical protein